MPKHRKRRIMLSIVSIVLFVVLSAQLSAVSFSVTAAGEHGELVAEEYERYRERFDRIEKIGDLENQGFRLLEDQIFAMPLQKLPEEAVDTTEELGDEVWFYAALDTRYHRLAGFRGCFRADSVQDGPAGSKLLLFGRNAAAGEKTGFGFFSGCRQ
mgnify:CR=1 FL=1